jgi:PKD repeat protein
MRSFHRNLCFIAALTLVGASCGGDNGGTPPANEDPVAAFTYSCDLLECTFTDGSTDPDGNTDIVSWDWAFGTDGTSDVQNPVHTFSAAGTYQVTLTVTDAAGASNTSAAQAVTVSTEPPVNTNPTAQFSFSCLSLDCTFTDESSDPDLSDAVVSWEWDFGDGNTATDQNPSHSYAVTVPDTFTVTLIAADNSGAADTTSNDVIVAPPAACEGGSCDLTLQADATVTVTLTSVGCTADGNTLRIVAPVDTTLFTDGCNTTEGTSYELGGAGNVFPSGTTIGPEVTSGSQDLAFPPTLRLQTGSAYPTWILEFDDGEGCGAADPSCGGTEPDFDDLIITITATP